jgi:maltose alpha-D-glucosyltransferase/alpha-amylase
MNQADGRRQPYWYKDAIIYQLHVKGFFDANDDGIGDFAGLISKLDYLKDLGVDTIWLLPFYPSPLRDDGYDISNYRGVNPSFGTLRDFKALIHQAHARGMHVITELVINHTSDQHPWFQRARRARRGSVHRNFYVWSDTDTKYAGTRIIFSDTETSNWTWDPVAKQYYWHRFFSHQPDLNYDCPQVVEAVLDVMRFWFDLGIDGMRLDAVPYLVEREGTTSENLPETHQIIKRLRHVVDQEYPGRFFLAEANQWPEDVRAYFGDGDECHMAFHFPLMPRMFIAIASEDRYPLYDIMRQTPPIPDSCQWAIFLRNHDEMTLEMVTDRERAFMYSVYAIDERARVNVGIRRRLAPLMENDRRRIELMSSLLLSMPGTPIVYYGDEIGMGDNIYLSDRDGVRTPMQWSIDRNGGFSRVDAQRLYLPIIQDPIYGYTAVNEETQARSSTSLLNWTRRLIAVRKAHKVFGRGTLTFLYPENRRLLAYLREYEGEVVLCVANLSRSPQAVQLDLSSYAGRVPIEMIGWSPFPQIVDDRYTLALPGHAFYWFLLTKEQALPAWQQAQALPPELYTLVLPALARSLTVDPARAVLERDVIPKYLPKQRWFAAKSTEIASATLLDVVPISTEPEPPLLALASTLLADGNREEYLVTSAMIFDEGGEHLQTIARSAFARFRSGAREGLIYEAAVEDRFWIALANAMRSNARFPGENGSVVCSSTEFFNTIVGESFEEIRRVQTEQSNTSAVVGGRIMAKVYRRLQAGIHPEIEMSRYLLEAGYRSTPKLLGSIEYVDAGGTPTALGVGHEYVLNQGDGWNVTLTYLERFLERRRTMPTPETPTPSEEPEFDPFRVYERYARIVGERLAEMHVVLAAQTDDPAFSPQPFTRDDILQWAAEIRTNTSAALDALEHRLDTIEAVRDEARSLLDRRGELLDRIDELARRAAPGIKTRIHGDFHMGQVIVVDRDVLIVDLEGETQLPFELRRRKQPPLRDVAGLLRSLDYAAVISLLGIALDRTERQGRFEPEIELWKRRSTAAFLAAYEETVGVPIDHELLDLFVIAKAAYELEYELANRPPWTRIAIRGLTHILDSRVASA